MKNRPIRLLQSMGIDEPYEYKYLMAFYEMSYII